MPSCFFGEVTLLEAFLEVFLCEAPKSNRNPAPERFSKIPFAVDTKSIRSAASTSADESCGDEKKIGNFGGEREFIFPRTGTLGSARTGT